jgi:hypothetical protein
MKRALWPAFLASALVAFGLFHLWDMTQLAWHGLRLIQLQVMEPPAAPTWQPRSTEEGKQAKDFKQGELALGVEPGGDYAPMVIIRDSGAVRAAGKNAQLGPEWVPIRVDKEGRVICSPLSFAHLAKMFQLKPGERIILEGSSPPKVLKAE